MIIRPASPRSCGRLPERSDAGKFMVTPKPHLKSTKILVFALSLLSRVFYRHCRTVRSYWIYLSKGNYFDKRGVSGRQTRFDALGNLHPPREIPGSPAQVGFWWLGWKPFLLFPFLKTFSLSYFSSLWSASGLKISDFLNLLPGAGLSGGRPGGDQASVGGP